MGEDAKPVALFPVHVYTTTHSKTTYYYIHLPRIYILEVKLKVYTGSYLYTTKVNNAELCENGRGSVSIR